MSYSHRLLLGWQGAHLRPLGHGHVAHPSLPGYTPLAWLTRVVAFSFSPRKTGFLATVTRNISRPVSRLGMSRTSRRMQCSFLLYSAWIPVEISSRTQKTPM